MQVNIYVIIYFKSQWGSPIRTPYEMGIGCFGLVVVFVVLCCFGSVWFGFVSFRLVFKEWEN